MMSESIFEIYHLIKRIPYVVTAIIMYLVLDIHW